MCGEGQGESLDRPEQRSAFMSQTLGPAGISVLGRSLSLCGKHPNDTIIHDSRDSEKRRCQKILDHFCWSYRKTEEPSRWVKESKPLWLVPEDYSRLGKSPLLLGPTILGPRKTASVSSLLGMYLANYPLSVAQGTLCCEGYCYKVRHLSQRV